MDKNININNHTSHALNMLSCILERVTTEVLDEPDRESEYYNEMATVGVMIADAINQIENDKTPLQNNFGGYQPQDDYGDVMEINLV